MAPMPPSPRRMQSPPGTGDQRGVYNALTIGYCWRRGYPGGQITAARRPPRHCTFWPWLGGSMLPDLPGCVHPPIERLGVAIDYGRGRLIAAIYGQLSLPSILNSLHIDDNIASAGASEAKIRMGTYFNNLAATWVPEFFFASCHFASRIERNWSSLR